MLTAAKLASSPLRIAFAVSLLALVAACDEDEPAREVEARPVRVITVEQSTSGNMVSLAGTVESRVKVDMAFRIGGRVSERLVNVGDKVEAGQLLARLDPADEENALRAAEASLAAAEGQLAEARINFHRQQHLYERQIAARVAFERAEATLTSAQAAADSAKAQATIAERRLNDTELRADAHGVVTARGVEAGEVVGPGRMIVEIARDEGMDAVFDVPAGIMDASPAYPEVIVRLSQTPEIETTGRVREVAPRADTVTGTFRVRVGLDNPPPEMRLGSVVTGNAMLGGFTAIEIPASALTRADGEPAVWVVDATALTVSLRQIGVQQFTPASVIVSDGLEPGEIVVTAGVQALRPGQLVRLPGDGA